MPLRAFLAVALAGLTLADPARAGWFDRFLPKREPPPAPNHRAAPPAPTFAPSSEAALYEEVVRVLTQRYADPALVAPANLAHDALQGLLAALGPSACLLDKTNAAPPRVESPVLGEVAVLTPFLGYARLKRVAPGAGRLLRAEMERLSRNEHIQGFILDLRFASGTAWEEVPALAAVFVPGGRVILRVARGATSEPMETSRDEAPVDIPLVALVNRATSGAAELLAATLQDQRRAILLGNAASAGNAFETAEVPLADGRILRLATGKFILPNAGPFFLRGAQPDVVVPLDPTVEQEVFAQPFREPEPYVEPRYSSEAILTGREVAPPIRDPKTAKPAKEPPTNRDRVLLQAMDLLRSVHALNLGASAPPTSSTRR